MSANARLSLRGQLALYAAAISVVATALAVAGLIPLWRMLRQPGGEAAAGLVAPEVALGLAALAVGIVFLVSYLLLVRWIAGPAERLLAATERVGSGSDAPLLAESGPALGRLGTAFGRMEAKLQEERGRVRAQLEELQEMNRQLSLARDAAIRQEKLATVGRLAAGVAHEIGNPLSATLGYLELLKEDPEGAGAYVERIERELRRIDRIVRDLLDYARPPGIKLEELPLRDEIGEVVRLAAAQPRFGAVEIAVGGGSGEVMVAADSHYLRQVLLNLLQNAAEAMGGEGRILLGIQLEGERVELTLADEGPGIEPSDLDRIFDPFFSTKAPGKGTGLGLSLCQGWLEAMGGGLEAANREEGGAEFRLTLRGRSGTGSVP